MKIVCVTGSEIEIAQSAVLNRKLDGLNLHRAMLEGESLNGFTFKRTNLRGAFLSGVFASNACFDEALLMNVDFRKSKLRNSSFVAARPISADFDDSDLSGTDFTRADVAFATFHNACLKGAVMLAVRLDQAHLAGAHFDRTTKWPDGFDAIAAGAVMSID